MRGGGINRLKTADSVTTEDKESGTSFVKVGELFNSDIKTFNQDNYKILLKYLTGDANATIATATALAETNNNQFASSGYVGTDASVLRAKTLSAGTEGSTSYSAKSADIDICVCLGGLDWQVMYLSQDKSGNTIATLWLDNNVQEAWAERENDEGEYYGYIDGGLYSKWSANWYESDLLATSSSTYPPNMYGSSYINAVTLNNGGVCATSGTITSAVTQSISSAFALFTMSEYGLTDYLVTPRSVSWQEEQSAKTIYSYSSELYNEGYATVCSYSDRAYYDAWEDSYLWLPSASEVGRYDSIHSKPGIWNTSTSQRRIGNESAGQFELMGKVGTINDSAYLVSLLRSSNSPAYADAILRSGKDASMAAVDACYAVRPALHLNLTAIEEGLNAEDLSDENGMSVKVLPTVSRDNGEAPAPSVLVKCEGVTLTQDVDYTVTYSANINALSGTVTVQFIGSYEGAKTLNYTFVYLDFPDGKYVAVFP